MVEAGRAAVLSTLCGAGIGDDIAAHITQEFVITPPEWQEKYALAHGAAFGLSHGLDQLAVFRPANEDAEVRRMEFSP